MAMLEKVIQDIRTLEAQELHAVQNVVDEVLRERESQKAIGEPLMTEAEFAEYLAAKGVVTLPEPMTEEDWREEENWQPVEVEGKPLSQVIIEERR
jgi:NifB/MoaA-like Fe-S oxidoreductase